MKVSYPSIMDFMPEVSAWARLPHHRVYPLFGKNVESVRHLCTKYMNEVLADDKMPIISLDVYTFIAQNLISNTHLTTLSSPSVSSKALSSFKGKYVILVIFGLKSGGCILHSFPSILEVSPHFLPCDSPPFL